MPEKFNLVIVLEEQANNVDWTWLHQSLLMLLDSPINHAGHLNVLIKLRSVKQQDQHIRIHKEIRIPRTFKRFNQLFCNFLQGQVMPSVPTKTGHAKLIEHISKSNFDNLTSGKDCERFHVANLAPKVRDCQFFTSSIEKANKTVIFVGFGPVDYNYLGEGKEVVYETKSITAPADTLAISRYPISCSLICAKLASSFEERLEIL